MNTEQKIIKNKVGLLKLSEMLVSVSEACKGHCQVRRERVVLVRNGRLSRSRLRSLSRSARPRRIAIARAGDS
jgi:hypothetical protein